MKGMKDTYPAILWDGNKKLSGHLRILDDAIEFLLHDFRKSSLSLKIPYETISGMKYQAIYGLEPISIIFCQGVDKENVFVVADPPTLKKKVEMKMKHLPELFSVEKN